jgi:hypothetical protein
MSAASKACQQLARSMFGLSTGAALISLGTRPEATSVRGLRLLVYEALSC